MSSRSSPCPYRLHPTVSITFVVCTERTENICKCSNPFLYPVLASTTHVSEFFAMTRWRFCYCFGRALAAFWFAAAAASSPSDTMVLSKLALSQSTNTESGSQVLYASKDAPAPSLLDIVLALASEASQSSITVVAQNTTSASLSLRSSPLVSRESLYSGSGNISSILNLTAANFDTRIGSRSTSAISVTLSTTSSTTAVGLPSYDLVTSTVSNKIPITSSKKDHLNSTLLTSSPVSTLGTEGQKVYRGTSTGMPSNRSFSTSKAPSSSMMPVLALTSTVPTNTAALADGIALGGALLLFSKNAAGVGPDIVKLPAKSSALKSLETVRSNLEDAFKERGGVDTGGPCVVKTKHFRLRKRDLASLLLNDFRCAIDSVDTLQIHLNAEKPDPSVISDDLIVAGTWGQELETDEESGEDDDDDDDETTTTSDPMSQRTSAPSKVSSTVSRSSASSTAQRTTTTSKTSSTVSRSSASGTSTISSSLSINATCYTGSEYLFPGSATASVAADSQSVAFELRDLALSSFFAMDPPERFTTSRNSTWTTKSSNTTSSTTTGPYSIAPSSSSWVAACSPTSLTYPAVPPSSGASSDATANCDYSSLPSLTINPSSVPNAVATPVPGQRGIAQCVYEM